MYRRRSLKLLLSVAAAMQKRTFWCLAFALLITTTALAQGSRSLTVVPFRFDPFNTRLVAATWESGTGCPTGATVFESDGTGNLSSAPFTDPACPTGDEQDKKHEGLLLVKTGPTPNIARQDPFEVVHAGAEILGVRGMTLTELGYDIRKQLTAVSLSGSHCGAGAPRFNVITDTGEIFFIGCNSPPGVVEGASTGWIRLRWGGGGVPLLAFPQAGGGPVDISDFTVERLSIVFDEAQDASGAPDTFGAAVLDNIDVNGRLIGQGPDHGEGRTGSRVP